MALGMNTAASTSEIAMIGLVIWSMALRVASRGERCSSRMMRSTDSMTTMASSTTMPMASTMPNSVSWLMEKPKSSMPMNAPISATGTTSVGISVARKLCRNTSITMNTSTTAAHQRDDHFVDGVRDERGGIERPRTIRRPAESSSAVRPCAP